MSLSTYMLIARQQSQPENNKVLVRDGVLWAAASNSLPRSGVWHGALTAVLPYRVTYHQQTLSAYEAFFKNLTGAIPEALAI